MQIQAKQTKCERRTFFWFLPKKKYKVRKLEKKRGREKTGCLLPIALMICHNICPDVISFRCFVNDFCLKLKTFHSFIFRNEVKDSFEMQQEQDKEI